MKKLAIISSHPIQYNAPLFKKLAQRGNIDVKVFYTWSQAEKGFFDKEFNKRIEWDIPLLDGYCYEFIKNTSKKPNSKHFRGIICPNLIEKIEKWNPNAILLYGWAFQAHFKAMRYFKGKIPILFRGDSTLLDKHFGFKKIFRQHVLSYVYRFIDYAFFVGTHNKKYFVNAGLKEEQLIFLPYSIDYQRFEDNEKKQYQQKANEIKLKLGVKHHEKVIAFIGKFIKKKNPVFVLKAIQQYNQVNKNKIKLIYMGSGILEKELKRLAKNDADIFFLPFVNQKEMPIAYRIADIFVLPSKGPQETWGMSVNEAIACKRLVLVSNRVGSAIDMVNDNNGEIFESNNTISFNNKLQKLLNKTDFSTKTGASPFNFEKAAQTVEELINQL